MRPAIFQQVRKGRWHEHPAAGVPAFTLVEVLVVVTLIVGLAAVLLGGLKGGGAAAALQAGQAQLVNAVTVARVTAQTTGHRTRLLIQADDDSPFAADRFRHWLVVVEEVDPAGRPDAWTPVTTVVLPSGVYLLPYKHRIPPGFYAEPAKWTTFDRGEALGSTALHHSPIEATINSDVAEAWDYVGFTPSGTVDGPGVLIVGVGHPRPADALVGASPVQLTNPDQVRGVSISRYGLPRMINERTGY